ncbi:MAG: cyclic nucleotide-binding domain-containing protein [Actinobacteria bacterium]|nr:MAG: cyclic nucleotide-binding domain-containing protein [Actinomycetota bacterium]
MALLRRRDPDVDLVRGFQLFAGTSHAVAGRALKAGQKMTLPDGRPVITEQQPGGAAYLVLEGRVQISRDGREIATVGPGELVGEVGLLSHRLRNATVTCVGATTLLRWNWETFARLREDSPAFRDAVDKMAEEHRIAPPEG